jgi:imidazoleglycerol-phosphate dehydratase
LHVRVLRRGQRHHVIEAAVKAIGLALRQALAPGEGVFSTKGAVDVAWEEDE